jgi:hypothetical protein
MRRPLPFARLHQDRHVSAIGRVPMDGYVLRVGLHEVTARCVE